MKEASARRELFPVSVVVVVHDEISLLRETLEEIAGVVEHIVSWREVSKTYCLSTLHPSAFSVDLFRVIEVSVFFLSSYGDKVPYFSIYRKHAHVTN